MPLGYKSGSICSGISLSDEQLNTILQCMTRAVTVQELCDESQLIPSFMKADGSRPAKTLPDGPKVGSVTLSPRGDWRMPSDGFPKMWPDNIE